MVLLGTNRGAFAALMMAVRAVAQVELERDRIHRRVQRHRRESEVALLVLMSNWRDRGPDQRVHAVPVLNRYL